MRGSAKIDDSLTERRGILELLGRLEDDEISLQELERIGVQLREAGSRALRPLVRQLAREKSGELITKYAYLLDFFETESWLDQLIQIALNRRDLGEDGRAALLVVLEGYGVDLQGVGQNLGRNPLCQKTRSAMLQGEEGMALFLDDFLGYPFEFQKMLIGEMAKGQNQQEIRLLEAILWHEDRELAQSALSALGRIRDPLAAEVLDSFLRQGDSSHAACARRSLRRLSFLGIDPPPPRERLPFHLGYATSPDGDGYRALFLSRWMGEGRLALLYMQVHETRGLLAAWGAGELTEEKVTAELERFCLHEELRQVSPGYVLELLRDALYHSGDLSYLPADYYLRRGMFSGQDLTPRPYTPCFPEISRSRRLSYSEAEEICRELFADPFFAGRFLPASRLNDLLRQCGESADSEQMLERFCAGLPHEELEQIRNRLFTSADFMRQLGMDRNLVKKVVALAESLSGNPLPPHLHPFMRALAGESIEWARAAGKSEEQKRLPAADEP